MLSTSIAWEKNIRCRERFGTAKKPSTASKRRVGTRWKTATPKIATQRLTRRKFWRRRRGSRWLKCLIGSKTDVSAIEHRSSHGNYFVRTINFLKGTKWPTVVFHCTQFQFKSHNCTTQISSLKKTSVSHCEHVFFLSVLAVKAEMLGNPIFSTN